MTTTTTSVCAGATIFSSFLPLVLLLSCSDVSDCHSPFFSHAHSTLFWKLHHIFLTSLSETIQDKKYQFRGFLSSVNCISSRTVYTERIYQQAHPTRSLPSMPSPPSHLHPLSLPSMPPPPSHLHPLSLPSMPPPPSHLHPLSLPSKAPLPSVLDRPSPDCWTAKMLLVFSPPAANYVFSLRREKGGGGVFS